MLLFSNYVWRDSGLVTITRPKHVVLYLTFHIINNCWVWLIFWYFWKLYMFPTVSSHCHCLAVIRPTDHSELQFCENPVCLLNALCSCTFPSLLFLIASLVLILCMSAFPKCYIRQWTKPFAISCLFRYSRTVLLGSEQGTGCCGGSPVGLRSISATVVTVKV
jgi:hypothetical protein